MLTHFNCSNQELNELIANIPGGLVILRVEEENLVLKPTYISEGFCKMLDMTLPEALALYGENYMAGIHPDDYARVSHSVKEYYEQDAPAGELVYRIGNGRGHYVWVKNTAKNVKSNGESVLYSVYTDVTTEVYAQQQQQKTEEKLMAAMEHTNLMFWEYYFDTNVCVNGFKSIRDLGMPERMTDYPECVIESGFVHPDSAEQFRDIHRQLRAGAPTIALDIKVTESDGHIEWKRVKYTTIFDELGTPVSALGTSEDITQQKNAEDRYQQADRYRKVLDAKSVGSFRLNLTRNICSDGHSENESILKFQEAKTVDGLFDYFFANYVEKDAWEELRPKFDRLAMLKTFRQGQSSVSGEHRYIKKTGEVFWFRTAAEMMRNPENNDVEAIIYAIDISEQKNIEMLIRGVVATEFDFVAQLNASTGSFSMYIQNKEKLRLPTLSGKNFCSENAAVINRYVVEEEREVCLRENNIEFMVNRLEQEGEYYAYYRAKNPDGTMVQKKSHVFYIDKTAKIICITGTDITHDLERQKRKNEALQEAVDYAQRANEAKTNFLSRMSHDIRTPMNAIIGMTELAKGDILDTAKVMESLSVIDSSSKHLMRMINDILDLSQIESGKLTLAKESFDCAAECKNISEMAQVMFNEKKQRFMVETQLVHSHFFGDVVRIKRIIINLLNNASKFTPVEGEVRLRISESTSANPTVSMLTISVIDSGCGIPEESIDSIFRPFYQARPTAGSVGTGLGLSIVKSIVEAKGGTISVKSTVGKGSTFIIVLPLEVVAENNITEPQGENVVGEGLDLSGHKILLVEDHPVNTMVAKRLLEKCGATVDTAENGAIGFEKFVGSRKDEYSIIFMDIQMPVMNGYEAAKAIRSSGHPSAKNIPMIAMTANAYAEDIKKSLDSGMNEHIAKPISTEIIARAISAVMHR